MEAAPRSPHPGGGGRAAHHCGGGRDHRPQNRKRCAAGACEAPIARRVPDPVCTYAFLDLEHDSYTFGDSSDDGWRIGGLGRIAIVSGQAHGTVEMLDEQHPGRAAGLEAISLTAHYSGGVRPQGSLASHRGARATPSATLTCASSDSSRPSSRRPWRRSVRVPSRRARRRSTTSSSLALRGRAAARCRPPRCVREREGDAPGRPRGPGAKTDDAR